MIENGIGGANTRTGLIFEGKTDLRSFLNKQKGYSCPDNDLGWVDVRYNNEWVASIFKKHAFYRFLDYREVEYKNILSKKLLPDDAIYVVVNNTFFIIECKFQKTSGSVDEKLQTCDFKRRQYRKLLAPLNMEVEYIYLLNDWFRHPAYRDVLDYIISVGCSFYFNYIPLSRLGLPVPY